MKYALNTLKNMSLTAIFVLSACSQITDISERTDAQVVYRANGNKPVQERSFASSAGEGGTINDDVEEPQSAPYNRSQATGSSDGSGLAITDKDDEGAEDTRGSGSAYFNASVNSDTSDVKYPRKTGGPYTIKGVTYYPLQDVEPGYQEVGLASHYGNGDGFNNKRTSNGEVYNMYAYTAAHKTLPMPTFVEVENLENGKKTVVRINDRGPFSKGRIIDLSLSAAKDIDMLDAGVAKVRITVLSENKRSVKTEGERVDIQHGNFNVQIAAYRTISEARKIAGRYSNAVIVPAVVNGKQYYRVRIAGYTSKQDATSALASFEGNFPDAFVVAE
ncbi:hypothetical protein RsTz2092_11770 [Deferribacterales bacterium RsTz2092]|nr:hypothetical protein AGMMS49941_07250 [Deferribacterales bacterium]